MLRTVINMPKGVYIHKKGYKHSNETKHKISLAISKAKKGCKLSEQHRKNISKSNIGHVVSEETRRKISLSNKGLKLSEEARRKLSEAKKGHEAWNKGKTLSEEQKRKMSESHRGEIWSKQRRENLSKTIKGRGLSVEWRKKISIANKGQIPSSKTCHGNGGYYESPYQGKIYLRSSYELAYAQYLNLIGEVWFYEIQTFDLGNTTYTPDFYLPRLEKFIEIKGYMSPETQSKISKFREEYPHEHLEVLFKDDLNKLGCLGRR